MRPLFPFAATKAGSSDGFASVTDAELFGDVPGDPTGLGWLYDLDDRRLKHIHGSGWLEAIRGTTGSMVAAMQMGKHGPDDALTLQELESARSGLRIQMLEAWMRATESYEKGEYRACIADCSEAAYCCWLACDVCVAPWRSWFLFCSFQPWR